MDIKKLIIKLGFKPKNGTVDVYSKIYQEHGDYSIDIDFSNEKICYGNLIGTDCKTTQNFSQSENFVVLECVNRLLEKGYKPQNIILEKTWPAGHGTSGRLDICVTHDDGSEYLLIECKTFGKEFDKAVARMYKDGGQLFTYFKFSNKADIIMLYASELQNDNIVYKNEIVKIEDDYRTGDVKDFYEKWNKLTKDNGVFDTWSKLYCFESKALTIDDLKPITQDDSSFIFNQFAEILRHNVVSDKGNAFNKIFTLFLCKVYDETTKRSGDGKELDFQWKEGVDDNISFQLRLNNLYKKGMEVFLSRIVSDFEEKEFENKCRDLSDDSKKFILDEITKIRLQKNNEFAIKEVYDESSFLENAKIVKEVVELLQGYRIRYNKRQQYLSDFFELLLTTGLKQEAGQFFTPVPIAQFMIKSLPLEKIIDDKLKSEDGSILPYMIDYAAGSGHFITEFMHEVQNIIEEKNPADYITNTEDDLIYWKRKKYEWATKYVYGIEKDYRLVKVGKVGCYLHGDGLANVILSDGLGNFANTKDYKGILRKNNDDGSMDNQQFDIILSNPPYSVSSFRQTTRDFYTEKDFELYNYLTDNSSEIESLFVERAKQLLKDGGIAGIILPSSILTNTGIYTKTRELLLKYFEIVAITELGSNTFMATGTNTVVLFLRRKNNYDCINLQKSVDKFFTDKTDVTINNIETPVSKYVNYVWEDLTFDDYLTLLKKEPNDKVKQHDIFKEYSQKIKSDRKLLNKVLEIEKEKLYYFILAYSQKIVTVKTGKKEAEKQFLGYEFSKARGREGIHPVQRGKSIEECTRLFDMNTFDNPQKASTYIYGAFNGDITSEIDASLKDNVSRIDLLDMMTFDRVDFEKVINVKAKKKIKIESKWKLKKLSEFVSSNYFIDGYAFKSNNFSFKQINKNYLPVLKIGNILTNGITDFSDCQYHDKLGYTSSIVNKGDLAIAMTGATVGKSGIVTEISLLNQRVHAIKNECPFFKYLSLFICSDYFYNYAQDTAKGNAQGNLSANEIKDFKIPLPPLYIQRKIVDKIERIEQKRKKIITKISVTNNKIYELLNNLYVSATSKIRLGDTSIFELSIGKRVLNSDLIEGGKYPVYSANVFEPFGYVNNLLINKFDTPSVIWGIDGDWMTNIIPANIPFYPTDHCGIIKILKEQFMLEKYLAFALNNEGKQFGFSRTKRASIDRVSGITIPVPTFSEQQKIVAQIEVLEKQIAETQAIIDNFKQQKQEILDKYLK